LLGFALVTVATGVWLEQRVARQLESGLATELTTIRNLNVAALRDWLGTIEQVAVGAATDDQVQPLALALFEASKGARSAADLERIDAATSLRRLLEPTLRLWTFEGYVFVCDHRIVAATNRALLGLPVPDQDLPEAARQGRPSIDLPHKAKAAAIAGDPLMWVTSPVKDAEGVVRGTVAFRLDTEKKLTRLLRTARFGESGETYAFDREGLFLTSSRFEAELRESKLLADDQRSALNLYARAPGGDLALGSAVHVHRPLTLAASEAIRGGTGVDVRGYRDYRGVEVVGAWTWLEERGFGVVSELDRGEAYASTRVIRHASRAMAVVIAIASLVIAVGGAAMRRLVRRARAAERLGQYTLLRKIGEGGMGVVYEAKHALLRRRTAIKVLKGLDDADGVRRFEREVQITASLSHPNTVAIYDYGRTGTGVPYYAMELLEGRSLHDLVENGGPLPVSRAIHILLQLLGSLAEAHERAIIHRDVKPANVMICSREGVEDLVKVVDFGLVKPLERNGDPSLTAKNAIVGTPDYMSPEALQDPESIDARSDLYAVGGVAFFILTGRDALPGGNVMEIISKHLIEEPPSLAATAPDIPPALDTLVLALLAKSRDDRPASADAVIERLEAIRDAGALLWTRHDASAWWKAHRARASGEPAPLEQGDALQIGLDGRGTAS